MIRAGLIALLFAGAGCVGPDPDHVPSDRTDALYVPESNQLGLSLSGDVRVGVSGRL